MILEDPSQIGEARRAAVALGVALGLSEEARSDVAIVVTEAATNAIRHGGGGRLLVQPTPAPEGAGLEVLCLDRGPGMANVAECLRDGYSTAGTPGNGLGAMARLAHRFEAWSRPGGGTAVLCRFRADLSRSAMRPAEDAPARTGGLSLPVDGETACGDAWTLAEAVGKTLILVVDGLGHGPEAAAAAAEGVRLFHLGVQAGATDPAQLLDGLHRGMRATRGAAAAIAAIDPAARTLRYAGVGNIAASVHATAPHAAGTRPRSLVSYNGIVGHQARKIGALTYPWADGPLLVLHSDGLQTRWRLEDYPGLALRDPSLVAAVLYRDFTRGRDDVTVVAHRDRAGPA